MPKQSQVASAVDHYLINFDNDHDYLLIESDVIIWLHTGNGPVPEDGANTIRNPCACRFGYSNYTLWHEPAHRRR